MMLMMTGILMLFSKSSDMFLLFFLTFGVLFLGTSSSVSDISLSGTSVSELFFNLMMLTYWISLMMVFSMFLMKSYSFFWKYFSFLTLGMAFILLVCFSTSNLLVFYLFFEFSIIPIFLMILGWGFNVERLQAGIYMFLYTLIFSLPFLLSVLSFSAEAKALNIEALNYWVSNSYFMSGLWGGFLIMMFMVSFPLYFLHIWLPKAHVEAPVAGSMILAAILLKLGGYGLIRMVGVSFFNLKILWAYIYVLSFLGAVITSFICLRQTDLKCLIAYTSVAHMGLVILSILLMVKVSVLGAMLMMLAHGVCSSGLFYGMNLFYERFKTRSLILMKGGITYSSIYCFWWFIFCMGSMSAPPTMNFFSEVIMIFGILSVSYGMCLLFFALMFLGGVYSIFLYVVFLHGQSLKSAQKVDLSYRESLIFMSHVFPLFIFILTFIFS